MRLFLSQLESVWLCAFNILILAELIYAKLDTLDTGDLVDNVLVLVKNRQKLGNATCALGCVCPYRAKRVDNLSERETLQKKGR
jgi:hypothetical protein